MHKLFLKLAIIIGLGVSWANASVSEDTVQYSSSTVITVSSTVFTAVTGWVMQKNLEVQNLDLTSKLIFCSESFPAFLQGEQAAGPMLAAGEARFWNDFRGTVYLIAWPGSSPIKVGLFRQLFRPATSPY